MSKDLFKGLNTQQLAAVTCVKGPSVILAGAGSGKTRVLIHKVINDIENHHIDPSQILMITFTNKAADEMKKRIKLYTRKKLGYVGTYHAFSAYVLRNDGIHIGISPQFVIYDEDDRIFLLKKIIKEKQIIKYTPSYILHRITASKNLLIPPERYMKHFSDFSSQTVFEIYTEYEKRLQKNHAIDFDGLIMKTVELFIQNPSVLLRYQKMFSYIFVDEFQDTNYAQYTLTRMLGKKYKNITVVGDFSQSIYSWRGADIQNLQKFQEDFPECKVFHLEENYRSTQTILDFAYKIISKNDTHPILKLFTKNNKGQKVSFYEAGNEEDEAFYISSQIQELQNKIGLNSIAVLYRTNAQSRAVEESFLHHGIPYVLIGGTRFYERKEIKDILSYIRLVVNPIDEVSKNRILKLGKRRWDLFKDAYNEFSQMKQEKPTNELIEHIFKKTKYLSLYNVDNEEDYDRLENIKELRSVAEHFTNVNEFLQQVALVESEYSEGEKKKKTGEGVRLMTLHQAKGLEFEVVFIIGVEDGILPHVRAIEDYFQLEEERRLFYVGITRAKKLLHISYATHRFMYGRRGEGIISRFLKESDKADW